MNGRWIDSDLLVAGTGHFFPKNLIDNRTVEGFSTNAVEDKLLGDLGVRTRHRSDDTETIQYMAVQAARTALDNAGLSPEDIDLLILSNWTDRMWGPELAPRVASDLGSRHTLSFDVCGGCTGFVLGVHNAAMHLHARAAEVALVVSSEMFSRHVRPGSKGELVTGDGAGAAVITRQRHDGRGLIDSQIVSDGERHELTGAYPPHGWVRSSPDLVGEAIASVELVAQQILDRNGLTIGDIDWLVPHSGTRPILDGIQRVLGIGKEHFLSNFSERGNLSSASIPTVLSECLSSGEVKPGDLILAPAVGGGWFYGGLLFRA